MQIKYLKLVLTVFVIAVFSFAGLAQSNEPQLWGRFTGGDIMEFNYHISQKYFGAGFDSETRLVLRICSDKGLLDSIALGAGMYTTSYEGYSLRYSFNRLQMDKTEILYAVYSGCESKKDALKTVEYWVVPKGAKLEVDDEISANEIRLLGNSPNSKAEFLADLKEAGSLTDGAANIFVGFYDKKPSNKLRENMRMAEASLKGKTAWKFEFVQLGTDIVDEPEPEFPSYVVVYKTTLLDGNFDPFDDYAGLPWNEEVGHLDNFAVSLTRNPEMVGYILYYVGEKDDSVEVWKRMDRSINYLIQRWKINKNSLILINRGKSEETRVMLQPVPRTMRLSF